MKIFWNSLLISVGVLLSTSTSIVLAESVKTAESVQQTDNLSTALPISDSAVVEIRSQSSQLTQDDSLSSDSPRVAIAKEDIPTPSPEIIVIEDIPPESDPDAIPSDRISQTPETIVIPNATPVSPETESRENTEIIITPTTPQSPDQVEDTKNTKTPETTDGTEGGENAETPETTDKTQIDEKAETPELSPEEQARQQKLIEADQLYMRGEFGAAQQLYRAAKAPFPVEAEVEEQPSPIYDPTQLSPAGSVYWRQAQAGWEQELETKTLIPLEFLAEKQPEFIPGHLRYAEALQKYDREDEALQVLERATALYPNEADLVKAKITALGKAERWLEASLAARQFALFHSDAPQAAEFKVLADENLERYKSHLRSELRGNAIANVITGALGYIFTGNLFGPISAIETTSLMLRGESAVGESLAERVQDQLPMLEDEEVLEYVREVGNKLAIVAGRDDFEYEFHVIMDDQLNAFALPGGKVFVNAGAILKTKSEAELAGLLAHELAHAVLSHGFQLVTQGNLIANITQYIPLGGTLSNLVVLDYSRDMERLADDLGTRILVAGGYAADGLHNLMVTLSQQEKDKPLFAWLSTHPDTEERINNIETLIERNGYNRYTYEGVARHIAIQEQVAKLLGEYQKECEKNEECEEK